MADREKKNAIVAFDPRTKLYVLLIFNMIMLTSLTEGVAVYIKPFLAFLAFLLLLNAKMPKRAFAYILLYMIFSCSDYFLRYVSGMSALGFMIRFFTYLVTKMVPGVMVAQYVLKTTKVSEFVASMERLHISQKLIIPIAVMFRFFPTVSDEYRAIQDAMRLRGISIKKGPVAMVEYRMVPLIVSLVKIGDELSAASVTRGLGGQVKRTNYCKIGIHLQDILFLLFMTGILFIYLVF